MNINGLIALNNIIINCKNISITNPPCSRNYDAIPLVMNPQKSQKVLLITRDPSNIANNNNTMLGWENTFFRNHILMILFNKYDIDHFIVFRELFEKYIFWTHFSKCFPGKYSNGNHKQPNKVCAKKFLKKEIDLINPDYIILVGKHSIKFITDLDLIKAIPLNGNNFIQKNKKKIEIISIIHPSNANNACKNDKKYKYFETIKYIQNIIKQYL